MIETLHLSLSDIVKHEEDRKQVRGRGDHIRYRFVCEECGYYSHIYSQQDTAKLIRSEHECMVKSYPTDHTYHFKRGGINGRVTKKQQLTFYNGRH